MTEEMAREQVVEAGRRLVSSGLIARTWGNVSCRIDSDYSIITPSGRDYLGLRPEDLVKVSIRDGSYQGTIKPSSEKGIHQDLYEQLPDQNFVIHTHQKYASVIGTLELDQVELLEAYPHLGDVVLCAQYGLPGTKTLRKHVKQAVSQKMGHAILMKNHGALCYGTDMEAAFQTAMELEEACWHWMEHLMEKQNNKAWEQPGMRKEDSERKGSYTRFLTEPIYQQFGSSKDSLYPYLDDFAQIVGTSVKNVGNDKRKADRALKVANAVFLGSEGVLLSASVREDLDAIQMILEKNCLAKIAGDIHGKSHPIGWIDRQLMRFVYLKKYSRKMKQE